MAYFVKHKDCPACGSSDGRAVYSDNGEYCFVCKDRTIGEELKAEFSEEIKQSRLPRQKPKKGTDIMEIKQQKPVIDPEKQKEIKSETTTKANNYRGISDETVAYFGVRNRLDEDGNVVERFYPVTQEGQLTGYKVREHPKDFSSIGRTGAECELFGQFRFNRGGKYVLLVEGEEDVLAAYQMLRNYSKAKGGDYETAVVSATTGANSKRQIAAQYKFLDSFDNIILCLDNDKAGKSASEEIIPLLPKGKVKTMQMRYKDPNEYLLNNAERQFIADFYDAKTYVPVGVVASNQISEAMRKELVVPKVPLPPFMHRLQDMMAGGIPLGRIVNLGSASGTGKSTICDEILYYMIFNSPHKVGIVTLESTVGQYGIKLLSRHISKKIELLDNDSAISLVNNDDVKKKEYELFNDENGDPRFYLVDDRDGEVTDIQAAIENLIVSCDCKVIVCDPVSDVIASLPLDEQENFMSWQKGMVKSHMVTFLNVCHTRKTGSGQKAGSAGADLHEEDIIGSSSLYKSAACNLMFTRNKEAEDEIEKNTTIMKATKIRWTGKTGVAGRYYYDNERHRLFDLEDYLNGET